MMAAYERWRVLTVMLAFLTIAAFVSLAQAAPDPRPQGVVFYLDGAGGGGLVVNWGYRIKHGLRKGGFEGEFHNHNWQTGLGPLLDHAMSEEGKRKQAGDLASEIQEYIDRHPGDPVHLIGLSAGTAVLVQTLESLPQGYQVDTVILLGSSMRADYDLARALRRVRGKMYVFASKFDPLLNTLVPAFGTADREFAGRNVAGLGGFVMPPSAGPETRQLYAKISHIPWRSEFARYGNFGSHTGATDSDFVEHYIAPLLKRAAPEKSRPPSSPPSRAPANPWWRGGAGR